jgi:uncharacterized protein YcgL (UPF0745 family)
LYLGKHEGFSVLPEALRQQLGQLSFVLEVELSPQRRLAQADPNAVLASIADKGYFLQLPPDAGPPEMKG